MIFLKSIKRRVICCDLCNFFINTEALTELTGLLFNGLMLYMGYILCDC